jgi:hypothetical protein
MATDHLLQEAESQRRFPQSVNLAIHAGLTSLRVGRGTDPDLVGVVPALRVGAAYADVRPTRVPVASGRCTCTDLAGLPARHTPK